MRLVPYRYVRPARMPAWVYGYSHVRYGKILCPSLRSYFNNSSIEVDSEIAQKEATACRGNNDLIVSWEKIPFCKQKILLELNSQANKIVCFLLTLVLTQASEHTMRIRYICVAASLPFLFWPFATIPPYNTYPQKTSMQQHCSTVIHLSYTQMG